MLNDFEFSLRLPEDDQAYSRVKPDHERSRIIRRRTCEKLFKLYKTKYMTLDSQ